MSTESLAVRDVLEIIRAIENDLSYNRRLSLDERLKKALDNIEPVPYESFVHLGNGVDIKNVGKEHNADPLDKGSNEQLCFKNIVGNQGSSIILGPRIMTSLFERRPTANLANPDAIKFNTYDNHWELQILYEFKLERVKSASKKTRNFRALTSFLRDNPIYFREALKSLLGRGIVIPSKVVIPSDYIIGVEFVTGQKQSQIKRSQKSLMWD